MAMKFTRLGLIAVALFFFVVSEGLAAQADAWKADWEKTLQAAKKEGQLTAVQNNSESSIHSV